MLATTLGLRVVGIGAVVVLPSACFTVIVVVEAAGCVVLVSVSGVVVASVVSGAPVVVTVTVGAPAGGFLNANVVLPGVDVVAMTVTPLGVVTST